MVEELYITLFLLYTNYTRKTNFYQHKPIYLEYSNVRVLNSLIIKIGKKIKKVVAFFKFLV